MNGLTTDAIICIQYCVISYICAGSLLYFIVVTNRSAEHSSELFFYKLAMGFAALCSFTDIMFALREFGSFPLGKTVNYISEILYSLGSICGAFCWFVYSEKKQQSRLASSARLLRLAAVPFAVMCLFTLTTPLHKLCFSISGSQYVRGVLNVPFTAVCLVFIFYSGIRALINSFRKEYHSRTVMLRLLFLYSVVLTAAQMLQVLVGPIMPFRSLFAFLTFMCITLRGMSETVTVDALSNVNNRFSFDRALDARIAGGDKFWLVMLDIDDFKRINDTYGHTLGDDAIRYTAAAIVRAVPHEFFVARYGGDEFAVVAPFVDSAVIAALEGRIRSELQKILAESSCPFRLDISAGYAEKTESINNIPDMVEAADRMLYERKRMKKQMRNKTGSTRENTRS